MAYGQQSASDILKSYRKARGIGVSVSPIIDRLRLYQQLAAEEDIQKRRDIYSAGKAALLINKTLREWEIARLYKPEMTLREFLQPRIGGVAAKKGAELAVERGIKPAGILSKEGGLANIFKGKASAAGKVAGVAGGAYSLYDMSQRGVKPSNVLGLGASGLALMGSPFTLPVGILSLLASYTERGKRRRRFRR